MQVATGQTRESQADTDGNFAIASLPPGAIDLAVFVDALPSAG